MNDMLRRWVTNASCFRVFLIDSQAKVPHVAYDYFDFHTECKRMRYDRVSLLIDRIGADLEGKG